MGFLDDANYGPVNAQVVCAHCGKQGAVRLKAVKRKKGISGSKATGAILTGGLSMVATGLSRKERLTQARCGNCQTVWHFG